MKNESTTIIVILVVAFFAFYLLYSKQQAAQTAQYNAQQTSIPPSTAIGNALSSLIGTGTGLATSWLSGLGSAVSNPAGLAAPSVPTNSQTLVGPQNGTAPVIGGDLYSSEDPLNGLNANYDYYDDSESL
jgi:hypothetical protein